MIRGLVLGTECKNEIVELVVHYDLGQSSLFAESAFPAEARDRVDVGKFVLLVEVDIVVFDKGGPVLSDAVLSAHADQPTPEVLSGC